MKMSYSLASFIICTVSIVLIGTDLLLSNADFVSLLLLLGIIPLTVLLITALLKKERQSWFLIISEIVWALLLAFTIWNFNQPAIMNY